MDDIVEEIKYRGFNPDFDVIKPSKEIIALGDSLNILEGKETSPSKLKEVRRRTSDFYSEVYRLHRVPFASEKRYSKIRNFTLNTSAIDPLRLPIHLVKGEDEFYGCINGFFIDYDEDNAYFYYLFIELSKKIREVTTLSYTHEITHTQLNHQNGIIREYYNGELLSIFNELVHGFLSDDREKTTLLDSYNRNRLKELQMIIQKLNEDPEDQNKRLLLEYSCYLTSIIKAYSLFLKFYYGSNVLRREIIDSVQLVLDGELTVEDLLLKFDIGMDNADDIKALRKYSKRYRVEKI